MLCTVQLHRMLFFTCLGVALLSTPTTSTSTPPTPPPTPTTTTTCVHMQRCFDACQSVIDHQRKHSLFRSTESLVDRKYDPCRLGCCLRRKTTYEKCSEECITYARIHEHHYSYVQPLEKIFQQCASGCNYKCRWAFTAVDPDPDGDGGDDDGLCPANTVDWTQTVTFEDVEAKKSREMLRSNIDKKLEESVGGIR